MGQRDMGKPFDGETERPFDAFHLLRTDWATWRKGKVQIWEHKSGKSSKSLNAENRPLTGLVASRVNTSNSNSREKLENR